MLLLDATHPYTGSANNVQPAPANRAKDEGGNNLYRGDYGDISLTQETLDAFNAMMLAFHEAQKDQSGYEVGRLYLDSNLAPKSVTPSADTKAVLQSGTGLILADQAMSSTDNEVSVYDSTTSTGKGVYAWIYDHAHEYGFVRASEAEGEENVFRYVGVVHATYLEDKGQTVAEYLETLTNRGVSKPLAVSVRGADNKNVNYQVYYLAGGEDKLVPEQYNYTVSGDNQGGFIVIVDRSTKKN